MIIDNSAAAFVIGGSAAITGGVTLVNLGLAEKPTWAGLSNKTWLGAVSFIAGWVLVLASLYKYSQASSLVRLFLVVAGVLVVLASAALVMTRVKTSLPGFVKVVAAATFVGAWLAVATLTAFDSDNTLAKRKAEFTYPAAALIMLSIMFVLPIQRAGKVVDGPGYAIFQLGWVFLALGHARIV
jgi:hypothetical protein